VTHLRKRMLEELQRRNYSEGTTRAYLHAVEQFARHFGKSPDKLGPDDLRSYQVYLLVERKLAVGSVVVRVAALRFFFVRNRFGAGAAPGPFGAPLGVMTRLYQPRLLSRPAGGQQPGS
jgi:Phage integrase, N-terminal SAM-like domain